MIIYLSLSLCLFSKKKNNIDTAAVKQKKDKKTPPKNAKSLVKNIRT